MKIHTIDLMFQGVPHAIASYLVEGPEGSVLVETGPSSTLPALLAGLDALGYKPGDIQNVLVTHIHLDHAGAAGWWAQHGAQIFVHERGAAHLADPSRLLSSAAKIYGEQMQTLWAEVLPAPAQCVTAVCDGDVIEAGGLSFTAIDTPGHASHHHAYRLDDVAFTGDVAGVRLPGSPLITLPTPPPEFELDTWLASVDRLAGEHLSAIYPTHFGRTEDVAAHLAALSALVRESAELVRNGMEEGLSAEGVAGRLADWNRGRARAAGVPEDQYQGHIAANPATMSANGLLRYWSKKGVSAA